MSQLIDTFRQDPHEDLDYTIVWTRQLGDDTISTSSWTWATGVTTGTIPASNTTVTATASVKSGTDGTDYQVENTIVTAGGRTLQGHILIQVRT